MARLDRRPRRRTPQVRWTNQLKIVYVLLQRAKDDPDPLANWANADALINEALERASKLKIGKGSRYESFMISTISGLIGQSALKEVTAVRSIGSSGDSAEELSADFQRRQDSMDGKFDRACPLQLDQDFQRQLIRAEGEYTESGIINKFKKCRMEVREFYRVHYIARSVVTKIEETTLALRREVEERNAARGENERGGEPMDVDSSENGTLVSAASPSLPPLTASGTSPCVTPQTHRLSQDPDATLVGSAESARTLVNYDTRNAAAGPSGSQPKRVRSSDKSKKSKKPNTHATVTTPSKRPTCPPRRNPSSRRLGLDSQPSADGGDSDAESFHTADEGDEELPTLRERLDALQAVHDRCPTQEEMAAQRAETARYKGYFDSTVNHTLAINEQRHRETQAHSRSG